MTDKFCPACGSDDISLIKDSKVINEPFGGQKTVEIIEYICGLCQTKGDFFNENEVAIKECLVSLKQDAVSNILNDFSNMKIKLSSIERALELPQRTLTKWKNQNSNPSSIGVALCKFLRLFPWLIDVAENQYEPTISHRIYLTQAFQEMISHMQFNEDYFNKNTGVATSNQTFSFRRDRTLKFEENMNEISEISEVVNISVF